jgi:hypothetical protein
VRADLLIAPAEAINPVIKAPDFAIKITVKRRGATRHTLDAGGSLIEDRGFEIRRPLYLQVGSRDFYGLAHD